MQSSERKIAVTVIASGRHCNDACPFMSLRWTELLSAKRTGVHRCTLFGEQLTWHYRKKTNGNLRLRECRKADIAE